MQIKTTQSLTRKQLQILKAISIFKANQCYSPTIAELAVQLAASRTTIFEHITELRKKEMLSGLSGKARSLRLTARAQKLLKTQQGTQQQGGCDTDEEKPDGIPLLGRVAAGIPIEAVETNDYLSLNSKFKVTDGDFALQVAGESMIEDGIHDGDYVICRNSSTAQNGQLVVADIGDENVTLKRFYKEKDCVRLQPANYLFEPIYSDTCKIKAIVTGLIRKF